MAVWHLLITTKILMNWIVLNTFTALNINLTFFDREHAPFDQISATSQLWLFIEHDDYLGRYSPVQDWC